MKRGNPKRERGAALLAMLAVIMLGASWFLVSQLNSESGMASAVRKARNAEVLNRAKQALIGYVAMQAAEAGEDNPGRLACPEAAGNIGGTNEGVAAGNCTLPAIGRFPWRTFGTDTLVDAAGEPLWYVVSPAWALSNSTTPALTTYINSNSTGKLLVNARSVSTLTQTAGLATAVSTAHGFSTGDIVKIAGATPAGYNVAASVTVINANTFTFAVDSALSSSATGTIMAGDSVVALIVAPGPAMTVTASTNCAARTQARSVPAPTINALDYLECYDAANGVFSTTGPAASFNNQVVRITEADIMLAIEAAIAIRIEREIVPVLTVYANPTWGTFPFPAPFGDPTTSPYLGQAGSPYQGLLPFNYHSDSCPVGDARCSISTITWGTPSMSSSGGPGYLTTPTSSPSSPLPNCTVSGSTPMCEGYYYGGALDISMTDTLTTQIANGLRTFTLASHTGTVQALRWTGSAWVALGTQSATVSRSLASDGSARFVAGASLPSVPTWGYYYVRGSRPTISDHSILSSTDPTTGWFVRNEWYRLLYYAIAPNYAPGGSLSCSDTGIITCLQVTNLKDPTKQRAVLALAGRSLSTLPQTRPAPTLQNYLDSAENRNLDSIFVQSPVNRSFNDRFISISKNP